MKNKIFLIAIIIIGLISNIFPQQKFRNVAYLSRSVGQAIYNYSGASTNVPTEVSAYNTANGHTGDDAFTVTNVYPYPPLIDNEWYSWHHLFAVDSAGYGASLFTDYINNPSYDIIMIKACFYTSDMSGGDGSSADTSAIQQTRSIYGYKWDLRYICNIMKNYPEKFFVIWTQAPELDGERDEAENIAALKFVTWMKDTLAAGLDATFGDFPDNIYVFDYFRKITGGDNVAPIGYCDGAGDSHPNAAASELIAPQLVNEMFDAAIAYESNIEPVELTSFSASINSNSVELKWQTGPELNNLGFEIQRSSENSQWKRVGFVKGNGTSANVNNYSFLDPVNYVNGKYYYRLKQIDNDGTYEFSSTIEVDFGVPLKSELYQNYPNPFNPSTEINFTLAKSGNITLKIYNSVGSEVATPFEGFMNSGIHSLIFNAKGFASGIYFYRINADKFTSTRKMLLIK